MGRSTSCGPFSYTGSLDLPALAKTHRKNNLVEAFLLRLRIDDVCASSREGVHSYPMMLIRFLFVVVIVFMIAVIVMHQRS